MPESRNDLRNIDEEYKMTRKTKTNLVGSIFVVAGLYVSAVQATPSIKVQHQLTYIYSQQNINTLSNTYDRTSNYAYPSITSDLFEKYRPFNKPALPNMPKQLLPGIQVAEFSLFATNKIEKNNSFFEFAAKFNDTLQQIIAYFNFSSSNTKSSKQQMSDKNDNLKVNFMAKQTHSHVAKCSGNKI